MGAQARVTFAILLKTIVLVALCCSEVKMASETQGQIMQMSQFILSEAKDKAEEITTKALQEFSVEKQRLVNQMKAKTTAEYQKKAKQIDTQLAIAKSTAVNKSRLEKIKTRQEVLGKLAEDTKSQLMVEIERCRSEALPHEAHRAGRAHALGGGRLCEVPRMRRGAGAELLGGCF